MKKNPKLFGGIILMAALGLVTFAGGLAFAQETFPTKPLTFIVSWSAGGGQDLVARALQRHLAKALGNQS